MSAKRVLELVLACLAATACPLLAGPERVSLAECDARTAETHDDLASYDCYRRYAESADDTAGAVRHLEARLAARPDDPHLKVALARVLPFARRERSIELLGEAIAAYRTSGSTLDLARTRCYRSFYRLLARDHDAARDDARRGQALAERAGDETLVLYCRLQEARPAILDADMAGAWGLLRSIELNPSFDRLSIDLRATTLEFLASVAGNLGLNETALRYHERVIEFGEQEGLPDLVASGSAGAAFIASRLVRTGAISRERAVAYAERAVEHARRPYLQRWSRIQLAAVAPWERARPLLEELLAGSTEGRINLLTIMGTRLIEEEPERFAEAERYLLEALEIALEKGNRLRIASTISTLSQARLRHHRDPESLELAEQALDAVEVLQGWQTGGTMATVLRARYAPQYYELFDALLHEWEAGDVGRLDEAFRVSERYRARALRSHLQRLGVHLELDEADSARLERTSRAISALQLRLLRGEGSAPERERWSREVSGLEEEMRLLRAAGLTREIRGSLAADDLPSRREVQDTLGAREALLTFMSSTDPASRSWVLVLTPTGLSAHPIPPRRELAPAVRLWLGLITERDATATASAARLWKDLLAGPVDALPEGITRLVIVPDGPLHELPFDALRPARDAPSLGERFEISLAPSATVWTALRRARDADAPAEGRGLFFADPWLPRGEETPALLRGLRDELGGLGPLPHARDEARVARRELGSGIEVLEGRLAREAALKTRSLEGLRILHFAAHSVLDGEIPERSSVLMAPGDGEDGLLQAREILDLELDGVLVALSACRSITGRPVDGEGVLGLSHAFLQAGAPAVVGTLWPVRDDEAAVFMREFYARLARGPSPLSALAETKRALAARGAPAAAWAGVVLIGDADAIAWPARSRSGSGRLGILLASISGLLALAAIARLAIRRRRTGHLAPRAEPPRSSRHDTE